MKGSIYFFPVLIGLVYGQNLWAQPSNDNCTGAIVLTDIVSWCSDNGAFTNAGATSSNLAAASCFSGDDREVWFTFTPIATDVTITVVGSTALGAGGTLMNPEVALYRGNCLGTFDEEQCETDAQNNHVIGLYKGGLAVGQQYLIRVQGRNSRSGTFKLCINNYNPPVNPGSDCFTGSVLCNKDPFVVQSVTGAGSNPTEANDAGCLNGFAGNVESNSTWFTWTAAQNGTLTFNLTPLNPADDLDFVVYELPNGPRNCAGKRVIRCMASGDFTFPSRCMGPTGLKQGANDTEEKAGCNAFDPHDNFLKPLDMEAGKSYALMVNNFTSTGNGFEIEFGGTGEFLGPQANFNTDVDKICTGGSITFTDASTFVNGTITGWQWFFGPDASTASESTQGPHTIQYNTAGTKSVVLTVTSDKGCKITFIKNITVECCPDHFTASAIVADEQCPGNADGSIDFTVTSAFPPLLYAWSNGSTGQDIQGLGPGIYSVVVNDAALCDTTLSYTITSPPPIVLDTFLQMPTCGGGTDGRIELVATGGTPPYEFNWQNAGFSTTAFLANISKGTYSVIVRDANDCRLNLSIDLKELELLLNPTVQAVTPPSCFGGSDGSIVVQVANGISPFRYDWNDGRGFVNQNSLQNRPAGSYAVRVQDANLCEGTFQFDMLEPAMLTAQAEVRHPSCNGTADGSIDLMVAGGVGNYTFSWNNGPPMEDLVNLRSGNYAVTVTDENGCQWDSSFVLVDPVSVIVQLDSLGNAGCFGETTGFINLSASGGQAPYSFSADGINFQPGGNIQNLAAGDYIVRVKDQNGCQDSIPASIDQPRQLLVDAGADLEVELGYEVRLKATPNDFPVTYSWLPTTSVNCPDCPSTIATPFNDTLYWITVQDPSGCTATDSVFVKVKKNRLVYIPTAFSPNNDGQNDYFTFFSGPAGRNLKSLKVFDRWGGLLFEGKNFPMNVLQYGWDGKYNQKLLPAGVYAYVAEVEFIDRHIEVFEGDVTLIK